jgi:cobalt-zinc-cadmium efflux system outer membrane protein
LQDAKYRHQAAWRQLANVVGVPALPPAPLLGPFRGGAPSGVPHGAPPLGGLEGDVPDLDWQQSLDRLLAASPLLRAQQAEIRASEYELKLARMQAIPNVNVQVVAERDHVEKFSSVSTLISLPVPLFNRNQGNIQAAEGTLLQQRKEYERIRLALADQLAGSFRQYLTLRSQAGRLGREILPKAKENLDLTTQGYRLGRFDFLRVLNARQTYFQTKLAHIDALTELHKTAVEITGLQLTGALNPTEAGTALQNTPGAGTTGMRGVLLQQLQEQRSNAARNLPGAVQAGER